ncbi:hypothetical protein BDV25DRAFT_138748 [Aspergillus avenaceus]|uniref:Polyketide synthase n=1 Tax=Aspergillus avenaceus TaxID=36643 RepID=A0A5N6TYQ8_ASPAV|nr:hypothetical protein BDV25DRAFT_138748 [Aspergillus avenaceus]
MALTPDTSDSAVTMETTRFTQEPIAVVSMACRLPGHSDSPRALWEFLMRGGVADTTVPKSRFNLSGFYDGSDRPRTLRSPGAMFMESVDPAEFDAAFFNISPQEAIAMDPQQRILLEVIYEALENAGLTLEALAGERYGCYIGGHTGDYWDIFSRDPDSRPTNAGIGCAGTMLSNRVSHFLGIKGPSIPVDTACSSSLVALDMACKSLHLGEINGAIVAASSLVLHPEYGCDSGPIKNTHSPTGRCHTFDANADGYIKAEGINAVILKRLDDAVQDGDPIRAVIRGIANNHSGRTPGIASPSAEAQAAAIRKAYQNADITDYSVTSYLECHGTGTLAGDPVEVTGISSVFAASRSQDKPLRIGSVKSNIGHSETAAGLSGLFKAIMILETGIIPGNPTFEIPNPNIDFHTLKIAANKHSQSFPDMPIRRVGVNSFGFGGSNSHAILEEPRASFNDFFPTHTSSYASLEDKIPGDEKQVSRPYLLFFSANNEESLKRYIGRLARHFGSPHVHATVRDVAYTLAVRRSKLFYRGYLLTSNLRDFNPAAVVYGKKQTKSVKLGFVFTGQGAQWPQMGLQLLETFVQVRECIEKLDSVLQGLPDRPGWSLYDELTKSCTPEHIRQPELSQPLVTALQIAIVTLFRSWGITPASVVGHSSGEIAAAYAAGYVTDAEAILIAYHRGKASQEGRQIGDSSLGMLAVGLGPQQILPYMYGLKDVHIACYNSPTSVTLSGIGWALEQAKVRLVADGVFARMLQVDLAYHSPYMDDIGELYKARLDRDLPVHQQFPASEVVTMFSSVTGYRQEMSPNITYWKQNMTNPVRFEDAVRNMLSTEATVDCLIEIGPHGALKGPVTQIQADMEEKSSGATYHTALHRGPESTKSTFAIAGQLFLAGAPIDLERITEDVEPSRPLTVVDLPNYCWNHSTKYWFETQASNDWRSRPFIHHDLLGGKVLGTPWHNPTFKKRLDLANLPWLRDHRIGTDIIFPASGYIAMGIEAIYQTSCMQLSAPFPSQNDLAYQLRNVQFEMALVLEEDVECVLTLTMNPFSGTKGNWYEFTIFSSRGDMSTRHASGMIRLGEPVNEAANEEDIAPLQHTTPGHLWTKACSELGFNYGPAFHLLNEIETQAGNRRARCTISLADPPSAHNPQSHYPIHPAALDGVFRATVPASCAGDRSKLCETLIPAVVDDLIINPTDRPKVGMAVASSYYSGRGCEDSAKSFFGKASVYHPSTGALLIRMNGLSSHKIDLGVDVMALHTLTQEALKADISTLTQDTVDKLHHLHPNMVPLLLDLAVHKTPDLTVLELDLDTGDLSSPWLDFLGETDRPRHSFRFMALDPVSLTDIENRYKNQVQTSFQLLDPEDDWLGLAGEQTFDLVIIKAVSPLAHKVPFVVNNAKRLLSPGGHLLAVDFSAPGHYVNSRRSLASVIEKMPFARSLLVPCPQGSALLCVSSPLPDSFASGTKQLHVVHMEHDIQLPWVTRKCLEQARWRIIEHQCPAENVPPDAVILILDELWSPILTHISEVQWLCLQRLVTGGCKLLWVTRGGQMSASEPDSSLAVGLFRSIRSEDPSATVMTLDMDGSDTPEASQCLVAVLDHLQVRAAGCLIDSEYVERGGVLYIHRIVPFSLLCDEPSLPKNDLVNKLLSENQCTTRVMTEQVGTLDCLRFVEVPDNDLPDSHVEVEIHAVGLNFKDVAVTMGIVPENQHLLGLEGSGVIRNVGSKVDDSIGVGSRVVFMAKGALANRIQVPMDFIHPIPDAMTYTEAATIPVVFCTALYSLFDMGQLQPGQTVLIHSAAGGVGIACIQLAQFIGASIYVTVSSEQKRVFLHETFGIPYDHMFTSRSPEFAKGIMTASKGKGIDVIVNSLTGDLLDATWRLCADGGTLVELGKRDIIERNTLSMEPFDRGCSFRAVDLSHPKLLQKLPSLLKRVFSLVSQHYIRPICPLTTFPMTQVTEAFSYLRAGRHMGKIVIHADTSSTEMAVPVRPLRQDMAFDSQLAYLIVGGLKGLCGSLAVHFAQRGARYLVVMCRSGCVDSRSKAVLSHCESLGCKVHLCRGDVSRILDVRRAFMRAPAPIGGIVQGVMLLRDRPYELMTIDEYQESIEGKVQGTWNLHHVSVEKGLRLDFFLLLSSISSVVGSPGQANYAAANCFLDSFAAYRRSMGLAAQTINLGVVEDVGVVAESQDLAQRHQGSSELIGIPERVLHSIVDCSLRHQYLQDRCTPKSGHSDYPTRLITGLTVPQDATQSGLRFDPRFRALFVGNASPGHGSSGKQADDMSTAIQSFHALVRSGASSIQLLEPCLEILAARLVRMLRYSAEQEIEPGQPLSVYGLDSLSTVELRNWIKAEMGAEVTTFDILNANSLIMLGERLVNKLRHD